MSIQLYILAVEDSEDDLLLEMRELRRGGYDPVFKRVETPEDMEAAIQMRQWDVVLSDYVMPRFSGLEALKILQKSGLDIPFIIVSGKIGEDVAAMSMKAGAHDYILKDNLSRLAPAIERELRDAATRHDRRNADEALKKSYEELELKVFEKTAELRSATEALKEEIRQRKAAEEESERLTGELKGALAKVKTLSGLP